jgi:serine phosphatase RsbU (regulator of sigma subunit)
LAEANDVLSAYIPPNMFVTCFCGVLDPKSGRLTYANAGHNLPCWRRESLANELRATGMPLGLMRGMSYEEKEAVLLPGDSILFYTDGLVEAHDPERGMFGYPRLLSLVTENSTGAEGLTAYIVEALTRFTGKGQEQEDDITLVTLDRSQSGSHPEP